MQYDGRPSSNRLWAIGLVRQPNGTWIDVINASMRVAECQDLGAPAGVVPASVVLVANCSDGGSAGIGSAVVLGASTDEHPRVLLHTSCGRTTAVAAGTAIVIHSDTDERVGSAPDPHPDIHLVWTGRDLEPIERDAFARACTDAGFEGLGP